MLAPPRTPAVGPLGRWEMVRLARSGHAHRARLLVLYFLCIAFVLIPVVWFASTDMAALFLGGGRYVSLADLAALGNRFGLGLLEAVLFAVAAMTPAYAAASLAEEKERGTLALLLTTPLSDREIVLGKAAGRLGMTLAAASAVLPILASTLLFGGVRIEVLLAGCLLIASTAALATAIGICAASVAHDFRGALLRAYGLTVLLIAGISPFVILAVVALDDDMSGFGLSVTYATGQVAVAGLLLAYAVRQLRHSDGVAVLKRSPSVRREEEPVLMDPEDEWSAPPRPHRDQFAVFIPDLPPVSEANPLLWKERYVAGRRVTENAKNSTRFAQGVLGAFAGLLILIGTMSVLGSLTQDKQSVFGEREGRGGYLLMAAGALATGAYLVPLAITLAAAISRERQRQTLETLLSLPVERRANLRAKVRAALERGWPLWPIGVAATGFGFGADHGWQAAGAATLFALGGGPFILGLGTLLTIRCRTELRTFRLLLPAVVLAVGGPVSVWNLADWNKPKWPLTGLAAAGVVFGSSGTLLWRQARRELEEAQPV